MDAQQPLRPSPDQLASADPLALPDPWTMDLASPDAVIRALMAGTHANQTAACRRGSIDVVEVPLGTPPSDAPTLIATGDLHDNPVHLRCVCEAAGLVAEADASEPQGRTSVGAPAHLTLHELIHGERLTQGMDMSYRVLARAAALKARSPEHVHTLLANHELAQIVGAGVLKNGVNCVRAFNDGVEYVFGELAPSVTDAINRFIASMPLALRVRTADGRSLLCTHSIPSPGAVNEGFDFTLLNRPLNAGDLTPRTGSAHQLVWGRGYEDPPFLASVCQRLGADLLIVGHELAPSGVRVVPPCAVVLNSDHPDGCFLQANLAQTLSPDWVARLISRFPTQS
jgi:hypothetical protein